MGGSSNNSLSPQPRKRSLISSRSPLPSSPDQDRGRRSPSPRSITPPSSSRLLPSLADRGSLGFGSMEPSRGSGGAVWSSASFVRAPVSYLLSYAGVLRSPRDAEGEGLVGGGGFEEEDDASIGSSGGGGEVSIRIIGGGDRDDRDDHSAAVGTRQQLAVGHRRERNGGERLIASEQISSVPAGDGASSGSGVGGEAEAGSNSTGGINSSYQRYDVQQVAKWIEQIIPFSLLLLVVFIRQHLQGFFVTIWLAAVMFKSNDIMRNQTALKGERKISVLVGFMLVFTWHVVGFYLWYRKNELFLPLIMIPPKEIPPFWHAIFIIMVNDTMVRQAAMIFKCVLLIYYKKSRGRNYRRQGQMLTLVEYLLLLYRALLPTPVWYRFFLNKDYGSLFSSLTTGLYLTFKLTSVVEKVQSFFTAFKALSRTGIHYGSHATLEQVIGAGDLCAICQEKMHAPILLHCKHIFCEECVSEWFERERTCPLCRALVKPADLKSFADGSTSLFFQLF